MSKNRNKPRLAFLCSGEGTTFEYLTLKTQFTSVCMITDNPKARAIEKAKKLSIPFAIINPKEYDSYSLWDQSLMNSLKPYNPHLIILAGFLKKIGPCVLSLFKNQILNSHPSLLPQFGGKGMYGTYVHKAVLQSRVKETGATIHLVNEDYDKGKILAQQKISVLETDTPKSIEEKVKKIEKSLYTFAIEQVWKQNEK